MVVAGNRKCDTPGFRRCGLPVVKKILYGCGKIPWNVLPDVSTVQPSGFSIRNMLRDSSTGMSPRIRFPDTEKGSAEATPLEIKHSSPFFFTNFTENTTCLPEGSVFTSYSPSARLRRMVAGIPMAWFQAKYTRRKWEERTETVKVFERKLHHTGV